LSKCIIYLVLGGQVVNPGDKQACKGLQRLEQVTQLCIFGISSVLFPFLALPDNCYFSKKSMGIRTQTVQMIPIINIYIPSSFLKFEPVPS
jgi:hypothetical protein